MAFLNQACSRGHYLKDSAQIADVVVVDAVDTTVKMVRIMSKRSKEALQLDSGLLGFCIQ